MNTREVEIYTDSGWGNVRIDPGSTPVKNNYINGYEIELIATLGSRAISRTGYTPVSKIPLIPPSYAGCEITIGTQIWMCKNYDIDFPGSKVYNNDEINRPLYGGLYTKSQVNTPEFCPPGWHIPTLAEWMILINYVGGLTNAGYNLKSLGSTYWQLGTGNDTFGFDVRGTGLFLNDPLYGFVNQKIVTTLHAVDGIVSFFNNTDNALITYSNPTDVYYLPVRLIKDTPAPSYPSFNDWFLPSKDELQAMYDELYLYGVGGFTNTGYWSSSEYNATLTEAQNFATGAQTQNTKSSGSNVRACRAFTSLTSYALRDIGPAGGYIFWKSGNDYLEAATVDTYGDTPWSNITTIAITGTGTAIGTGQANTSAIIGQVGHTGSAAKICNDYVS
jgi:uncharacterized protein (TIGR02145 family)